jgi:hypothetical protein
MSRPRVVLAGLLLILAVWVGSAEAASERSAAAVRAFRREHPCPATGKTTGPCPGWVVDHIWPLCAGGPDAPSNMQWQRYADSVQKDRLERALCRCLKRPHRGD